MNMKIAEIKPDAKDVSVTGKITDIYEPRTVNTKFGYKTQVATAVLEDETGTILLPLWGKKIQEFKINDSVEIVGAYVTEFKGDLQLNVPKNGEIKKV